MFLYSRTNAIFMDEYDITIRYGSMKDSVSFDTGRTILFEPEYSIETYDDEEGISRAKSLDSIVSGKLKDFVEEKDIFPVLTIHKYDSKFFMDDPFAPRVPHYKPKDLVEKEFCDKYMTIGETATEAIEKLVKKYE